MQTKKKNIFTIALEQDRRRSTPESNLTSVKTDFAITSHRPASDAQRIVGPSTRQTDKSTNRQTDRHALTAPLPSGGNFTLQPRGLEANGFPHRGFDGRAPRAGGSCKDNDGVKGKRFEEAANFLT